MRHPSVDPEFVTDPQPPHSPPRRPPETLRRAVRLLSRSASLVTNVLGNANRLVNDVTRDAMRVADDAVAFSDDVQAEARRISDGAKAAPRVVRVVGEGLRIAAIYKLRGASDEVHELCAERLYQACVDLRGGVLKIGQFLSCRVDLLPPAYVTALSRLQDRVPAVPTAEIRARIEHELGRPVAELFAEFDDEPLAAASIAQVHAATLHTGERVVIKVQVPGIDEVIEADLTALRLLAGVFRELLPQLDLIGLADELARAVRGELDYRHEATACEAIRADMAADVRLRVPRVHREFSTSRVLVLERLDGVSLTAFLEGTLSAGDAGAADRDRVLETLARAYAAQILRHGRFQADAHPGNFLICPGDDGPVVGLLDFGCVAELTPAVRRAYARVVFAAASKDAKQMLAILADLGFRARGGDPAALERLAATILTAFQPGVDLGSIDPRAQLDEAMKLLRETPSIDVPREFVLLGRVLGSLGGMYLAYRPKVNLFMVIGPCLQEAMRAEG